MTDTKAIIKELCSMNCIGNITIFSEKLKLISDNKKTFVLQYILNTAGGQRENILKNPKFINLFTDNSKILHDIIIYIITNISVHKFHHSTDYNIEPIIRYIKEIICKKEVKLKKEDYKVFHETSYKYFHNKSEKVYELYDIFKKYECEDELFNDDIIENDADKKDKEIDRLKLEMEELKKFYINS